MPAEAVSVADVAKHTYGQGDVTTLSSRNTFRRQQCFIIAVRSLQGFAVTMIVVFSLTKSESTPVAMTSLYCSAALCGMALAASFQEAAVTHLGQPALFAFRNGCIATGLLLLRNNSGSAADLAAATMIGAGVVTEWSPVTEMFRRLLSSRSRWQGIRLWSVAFPVGIIAGISTAEISDEATAAAAVISALCVPAWFFVRPMSTNSRIAEPKDDSAPERSNSTAATLSQVPENINGPADSTASGPDDCDAVECCGGTQDILQTPFPVGVVISTVGISAVWNIAFNILHVAIRLDSQAAATAVSVGLVIGTWLLFSVAPRVGYVVGILPFLALGGTLTIACGLASPTSPLFVAICMLCGLFTGGVACGTSALVGELFSDCPDDAARTRVVTVSLFASAILVLLTGILQPLLRSAETIVMLNSLVFLVGIFAVRAIPGPIISSLGRNDPSDTETESERDDILASIRNP
ncbi:MAG: hypothetical protein GY758_16250 [Fuerstiella sp.]|nr:hypothetical protein [Fuerstiella sp.]